MAENDQNNRLSVTGEYQSKKGELVKVSLDLISFMDEGVFIIYAPALDIYGYGYDENEARESFKVSLNEFLDYTLSKNTLHKELKKLGWEVKSKKKFKSPAFDQLLSKNKELKEIVNNRSISKYQEDIAIPA